MDWEDPSRGVVDPEVRAHVYSLVSAVSEVVTLFQWIVETNNANSLEGPAPTSMAATSWETTP